MCCGSPVNGDCHLKVLKSEGVVNRDAEVVYNSDERFPIRLCVSAGGQCWFGFAPLMPKRNMGLYYR